MHMFLTLLSLHDITVPSLTAVYFVSELHSVHELHRITPYYYDITYMYMYKCKGNLHITMITVQGSTIVLFRSTIVHVLFRSAVTYHIIKVYLPS